MPRRHPARYGPVGFLPVAKREIILHEYIDILGQAAWPYMEHIKIQNRDARVGFELLGTWYTMGITARWPQVVNLWDSGGWDGWLERVDRLNLKRKSNDLLDDWWEEAYKLRTGGYDRVLGSVPESPPLASVLAGVGPRLPRSHGRRLSARRRRLWLPMHGPVGGAAPRLRGLHRVGRLP